MSSKTARSKVDFPRLDILQDVSKQRISSSTQFAELIAKCSVANGRTASAGAKQLIDSLSATEQSQFFSVTLPFIIRSALDVRRQFSSGIPLLSSTVAQTISFKREQCASLVACSFLCLWTVPRTNPLLPPHVNCTEMFIWNGNEKHERAKLLSLLNYFHQLAVETPSSSPASSSSSNSSNHAYSSSVTSHSKAHQFLSSPTSSSPPASLPSSSTTTNNTTNSSNPASSSSSQSPSSFFSTRVEFQRVIVPVPPDWSLSDLPLPQNFVTVRLGSYFNHTNITEENTSNTNNNQNNDTDKKDNSSSVKLSNTTEKSNTTEENDSSRSSSTSANPSASPSSSSASSSSPSTSSSPSSSFSSSCPSSSSSSSSSHPSIVCFANAFPGGGVFCSGCAHEELLFVQFPEMLASVICCEKMAANEAIVARNVRRFSRVGSFGYSAEYLGPVDPDNSDVDSFIENNINNNTNNNNNNNSKNIFTLLLMDAIDFRTEKRQNFTPFSLSAMERDLLKAYAAFSATTDTALVTGHWGCNVFRGDAEVKSFLQISAALLSQKKNAQLIFYHFPHSNLTLKDDADDPFQRRFARVYKLLVQRHVTISGLFRFLKEFSEASETLAFNLPLSSAPRPSFFDFLEKRLK